MTYTHNTMDRLDTRIDALNQTEFYQYDPAGNLVQVTDRKGQVSVFTYDAQNRRVGVDYADGSSTTFTYDSAGRMATAEDSTSGKIEFTYDALDRLVKELTPQGVVQYTYDALGRRSTMTANGQQPVAYSYDATSRLTQVEQGSLAVGLGYDAAGRRTSLTYPNGTNTSYSYDNASRMTSITHDGPAGLIEALTYTYDAAGNRISIARTNAAASLLPDVVQAAYDAANEQIQFNSATPNLTFDANGNLTSQTDVSGTTTYAWDARNRLVAIAGSSLSASFSYDVLGRRVSKTLNGITTQFLYDSNDIVVEIGGGAVGASYIRSLNIDEPFVRQANDNEYYHADALSSTVALSNSAAVVPVSYSYEAFGRTTVSGSSSNPFQYTGRENDGAELHYYRARYYAPSLFRFVREDPILAPLNPLVLSLCRKTNSEIWSLPGMIQNPAAALGLRLNQYVYVRNNPINFSDPTGLIDKRPCGPQIDECIRKTRGTPLGDCLGTAYGLYFGGDTSNCKKGIFTRECLRKDQSDVINNCLGRGPFPAPCTNGVGKCIDNDPNFK